MAPIHLTQGGYLKPFVNYDTHQPFIMCSKSTISINFSSIHANLRANRSDLVSNEFKYEFGELPNGP